MPRQPRLGPLATVGYSVSEGGSEYGKYGGVSGIAEQLINCLIMLRALLFIVMLLGNVTALVAQTETASAAYINPPPMIMNCSGYTHGIGKYEYKAIHTLADMPAVVVENIKSYLLARVGKSFYETLTFIGGQQLNLAKEDSAQLRSKESPEKLAIYCVRFNCLTLRQANGKYFEACASFNVQGAVVDSINLPPFARKGISHGFISAKDATRIGRANWQEKNNTIWIKRKDALLSYSPLNQSLVWWFSKATAEGPGKSHLRRIFIDASSGAIVRTRNNVHKYAPF